jgi:hypothetical protein
MKAKDHQPDAVYNSGGFGGSGVFDHDFEYDDAPPNLPHPQPLNSVRGRRKPTFRGGSNRAKQKKKRRLKKPRLHTSDRPVYGNGGPNIYGRQKERPGGFANYSHGDLDPRLAKKQKKRKKPLTYKDLEDDSYKNFVENGHLRGDDTYNDFVENGGHSGAGGEKYGSLSGGDKYKDFVESGQSGGDKYNDFVESGQSGGDKYNDFVENGGHSAGGGDTYNDFVENGPSAKEPSYNEFVEEGGSNGEPGYRHNFADDFGGGGGGGEGGGYNPRFVESVGGGVEGSYNPSFAEGGFGDGGGGGDGYDPGFASTGGFTRRVTGGNVQLMSDFQSNDGGGSDEFAYKKRNYRDEIQQEI